MFAEVIIICALVIMIGWNKGVKDWFEQFEQPVLKEVDISGINSPNAILMQARGGKILGEINGGGSDLSGFYDEDHDGDRCH